MITVMLLNFLKIIVPQYTVENVPFRYICQRDPMIFFFSDNKLPILTRSGHLPIMFPIESLLIQIQTAKSSNTCYPFPAFLFKMHNSFS